MNCKRIIITITLAVFYNGTAQETNAPKFGKGLFNLVGKDSTWTMNIGARIQFLGTTNWDSNRDGLTNPASSFSVRRARLKFNGFAFSPKLKYKLELGLSNRDISGAYYFSHDSPRYILDAVVKWNFHGNFQLWAGQAKLPGNRERVISSGDLQLVDRSLLNSRFTIDRDLGIQLRHHFILGKEFIIKEAFSVSQGEGRNVTRGNLGGHQYTTRLEFLPFGKFTSKGDYKGGDLKREPSGKLAIGITYDFNNNAVKNRSNQGFYMYINNTSEDDSANAQFYETNISTVFVDAMFKYKGFSFMGEYAYRNAEDAVAKNTDGTETGSIVQVGDGLNLQTGYLFKNNIELTGRYTNISYNKIAGSGDENQYTLGLSKYIAGHKLKVQTDVSYLDEFGVTNQLLYRLQLDIHF